MREPSRRETTLGCATDQVQLAVRRAFGVQLRAGSDPALRRLLGRVEHVSWGQATTLSLSTSCSPSSGACSAWSASGPPLTPRPHADPPDQTWLRGPHDDGDYDDVILLVLSTVVAIESCSLRDGGRLPVIVASLSPNDERLSLVPRLSWAAPRAPPVA